MSLLADLGLANSIRTMHVDELEDSLNGTLAKHVGIANLRIL